MQRYSFNIRLDNAIAAGRVAPGMRAAWQSNHSLDPEVTESVFTLLHDRKATDAPADVAPWLDTRQLSSPPEPWNDAHWERDRRRAEAADVALDQGTWRAFAEVGQDGVAMLKAEREQEQLADEARMRDTEESIRQDRANRQGIDEYMRDRFGPNRGVKQGPVENGIGTVRGGFLEF